LPESVEYISNSVTAPAIYSLTSRSILWAGILTTSTALTIQFQVTPAISVAAGITLSPAIANTAWLNVTGRSFMATAMVNPWRTYLPLIARQGTLPALLLHLDEAAGATVFHDASPTRRDGTCSGSACPTAGVSGVINTAAHFDGVDAH
jgi:protein involved in polysaccharide export with SLBB domain